MLRAGHQYDHVRLHQLGASKAEEWTNGWMKPLTRKRQTDGKTAVADGWRDGVGIAGRVLAGEGATARTQAPAAASENARSIRSRACEVIDLVVERGAKKLPFKVELAASPEAQSKGLMFRTELGENEGMLFPSAAPEPRSFWMKNTPLSLDIIFVGSDGRISNIAANTVPYSLELGPVRGVCHRGARTARGQGGGVGDRAG